MKRKLIIALFTVIVACLLSFSVSAANEVTLVGGEKADLTTVFKVDGKNQVTGFNSGYTKNDVTDVIFPDYIVGLEANALFSGATNLNTLTFEATDTFFISGDGIFSQCSVKKITFNPDCVVEIRKGNFSGCTSLTEITFPKFKVLAGSAFNGCKNMASTNELVLVEGMTEIGGHAFHDCILLKGTVRFPSTLEKIQEYSFEKTGFEEFDLSKCANLTLVGGGYGGPFTNSDFITRIDLSGCTSLTKLNGNFISSSDNLTEVILPPNLETIQSKAFAHCYKLQSIVLPASLTYIEDEAFHSARANQTVKTFTVYVQSDVQFGKKYYPFRDSGAKIEFVLIGDGVTAESFKAVNTYPAITGATVVDYLDPQSPWTYTVGTAITTHTIVENYCSALAMRGEHLSSDNPCVTVCSECGYAQAKENPVHTISVFMEYANGFDAKGTKVTKCTNEGCSYNTSEEIKAVFVCLGYSVPEKGKAGIVLGYKVNKDAIKEYKDVTGNSLSYGVFTVLESTVKDGYVFDENGQAISGSITADLTKQQFDAIEIKVRGFSDTQKDLLIAMGVYTATGDGNTVEYSYMQPTNIGTNKGNYYFVSYNGILG